MSESLNSFFSAPFWGRGFRPFFFLGSLFTVLSIGVWGAFYAGYSVMPPAFFISPISWHAHEMVYGFCMAIVSGFLLTAVTNWTGKTTANQMKLAGLCVLWLAGRVVMGVDLGLPPWLIIAVDVAYIPALALTLALPLLRSWNKRNFVFLAILSILFGCNLWFLTSGNMSALYVGLMMILCMVSLIGGRIIPAFTVGALRRRGIQAFQTDQPRMDIAALASLAGVAVCLALGHDGGGPVLGVVAGLSCAIHAWRMRHYHTLKTLSDPLLWILHAGFAWLVLGLGMLALTGFGVLDIHSVLHALTVGCIGSMILGMICRVTLGHTGRDLRADTITTLAFYAIQGAAVLRVFGPIFAPGDMAEWVAGSALLWALCFMAYLALYTGALFGTRPDGRPA